MNRAEHLLLYGNNLWCFGEGMLGPLFAIFTERIGGTVLDITWAYATYLFIMGFLMMYVGKVSDGKYSKELIMVVGFALNALFTFGYLFVHSIGSLLFVQIGLGIAAALATPTWEALYSAHVDKKRQGTVWGIVSGEQRIITGLAILIGGAIISSFSFTGLFVVMGFVQIIATLYQGRILFLNRKKA